MDEIPHRRGKRRAQRQYALAVPDGDLLALFRLQRGRRSPAYARLAMAADAALRPKESLALLDGAAADREFVSRRTDGNIQAAEFFRGGRPSHAICLRE